MVPSDEPPTTNLDTVMSGVTRHESEVSKDTDETNNDTSSEKVSPASQNLIADSILDSFELSLIKMRERALNDHTKRMNIVRMLARGSGMDNQQQENFVKEIDKLFHPPFIE